MAHVFISYKREDRDFAFLVRHEIVRGGFDAWIDDRIPAGESWIRQIEDALVTSFALVVILTPHSQESKYVTYEWSFALGKQIPVIPILRHTLSKQDIHQRLSDIQSIDFRENYVWERLLHELANAHKQFCERQETVPVHDKTHQATDPQESILMRNLNSDNYSVRLGAIKALGTLRDEKALPSLIDIVLKDSSGTIREAAINAIAKFGTPDNSLPTLFTVLMGDANAEIRRAVARALGRSKEPTSVHILSDALRSDRSWEVRLAIVQSLTKIEHPETISAISAALYDSDVDVLAAAIRACQQKKDAAFVSRLSSLLYDQRTSPYFHNEFMIEEEAAAALDEIGTPEALAAIQKKKENDLPF